MGSGDDVVDKDNITGYECIVLDEGEVDNRTDLSVSDELRASGDCPIQDCYRTTEGDIIITSDCQHSGISCLSEVTVLI